MSCSGQNRPRLQELYIRLVARIFYLEVLVFGKTLARERTNPLREGNLILPFEVVAKIDVHDVTVNLYTDVFEILAVDHTTEILRGV